MDERLAREIITGITAGVAPAVEGVMFILVGMISLLHRKNLLTTEEIEGLFDGLEETIEGAATEGEKAVIQLTIIRRVRQILL